MKPAAKYRIGDMVFFRIYDGPMKPDKKISGIVMGAREDRMDGYSNTYWKYWLVCDDGQEHGWFFETGLYSMV